MTLKNLVSESSCYTYTLCWGRPMLYLMLGEANVGEPCLSYPGVCQLLKVRQPNRGRGGGQINLRKYGGKYWGFYRTEGGNNYKGLLTLKSVVRAYHFLDS